eukprot:Phypoly_transcript_17375.p1 GENE.Phypoly_transcript_17375~~Phypoly_transcript_17375.p1  ORF type:complete len:259 (+),score=26.75 Phypoly_transcript_17375:93-779(+)
MDNNGLVRIGVAGYQHVGKSSFIKMAMYAMAETKVISGPQIAEEHTTKRMTVTLKEYPVCKNLYIVDIPGIADNVGEYITKIDAGARLPQEIVPGGRFLQANDIAADTNNSIHQWVFIISGAELVERIEVPFWSFFGSQHDAIGKDYQEELLRCCEQFRADDRVTLVVTYKDELQRKRVSINRAKQRISQLWDGFSHDRIHFINTHFPTDKTEYQQIYPILVDIVARK